MRLQIPYIEFEQFLSKNFQQKTVSQIRLAYVDENTIQVNAVVILSTIQDLEATIHVEENLSVKAENDNGVTLTYQAGMVIDLMGKRVLELYEDVVKDMLEVQDNHTVLVHLDKIDKLNTILEKVEASVLSQTISTCALY